jgi:hypothetical protein
MKYTFDILGVSPIVEFFDQQQKVQQHEPRLGVEYLGTRKCTLDELIQSVEQASSPKGWDVEDAVDTVIEFWVNNPDRIWYWKDRLTDAGEENLLVTRLADVRSLRSELERLFGQAD